MGTWFVCNRPDGWREWLANFKFPTSGSYRLGHPTSAKTNLAYLGDGKAKLGKYSITVFDPIAGSTFRTNFRLEGQTNCADEGSFKRFMQSNNRFFREQVMVTVRNCEPPDLIDPDLKLLEKKLVSRVNRALGHRFLKTADIKEFSLIEATVNSSFVKRGSSGTAAMP